MNKMRIFKQNKLWRDKLPAFRESLGSIIHIKQLSDAEYDMQLREKLSEEAQEVCLAQNKKDLMEELADLQEVIDALCALHTISKGALEEVQAKKRDNYGGFYNRTYVTNAEHPVGSYGEQYCLAQPNKYPEVL